MDRHIVSVISAGHALSPVKKDSRHASLNDEQMSEVDTNPNPNVNMDAIVTNPPYEGVDDFVSRCVQLEKSFTLLRMSERPRKKVL